MDTLVQDLPFDATRLRALHAASLGGEGVSMEPAMQLALDANFGSVARWREAFAASAKALGSGPGWVLLCFQPLEGTLVHQWATEPTPAVADGVPILALAKSEHSDHLQQGAAKGSDVQAFMAHIDWAAVYARYQHAVHAASEAHGTSLDDAAAARLVATALATGAAQAQGALVIDVRRAGVYAKAAATLPGAQWRDPALVGTWAADLPRERELLVYCVYGHEVGRATALRLHAAGLKARYLNGGIDGWQNAGRPVQAKT
jgi:superoxide dismutase, Fe-Mn family